MIKNSALLVCLFALSQSYSQTAEMKAEMLLTELVHNVQVLTDDAKTLDLIVVCEEDHLPIEGSSGTIIIHQTIREAKKPAKLLSTKIPVKISNVRMADSKMLSYFTLTLDKESKELSRHLTIERGFYLSWKKDLLLEHELIKDQNGKVISDNYYSDGLPVGKSTVYSSGDSVTVVSNSMLGQYHGEYEIYDNDTLFKKMNYFMGEQSGKEIWYYSNGNVWYDGQSISGLKEGEAKNYYENGALHTISYFENDTLEGEFLSYYENGNKKVSAIKHKGKYHGESISYYENGQIHFVQEKINGVNSGSYLRNYKSGKLEVKANWLNDKLEGERIDYYENGDKKTQGSYKVGAQVGIWNYWDLEGVKTTASFD
jgi:antitoxin component YwqK of YwqJK toxin-antitoxin module